MNNPQKEYGQDLRIDLNANQEADWKRSANGKGIEVRGSEYEYILIQLTLFPKSFEVSSDDGETFDTVGKIEVDYKNESLLLYI